MRAMEQNLAARRLQRVFRRRQEQSAQQEEERLDLPRPPLVHTYRGHRNARTMIKQANFWGREHVISGSDCGHVFVWDRRSARLVMMLEADKHVVNCVQPHPFYPGNQPHPFHPGNQPHPFLLGNHLSVSSMITLIHVLVCVGLVLATSGIDYDVKLWTPLKPEPDFDRERAEEVRF